MLGVLGNRTHHRERIEPGAAGIVGHGFEVAPPEGLCIGHENHVEQTPFGQLRDANDIGDVGARIGDAIVMAPGGDMMAAAPMDHWSCTFPLDKKSRTGSRPANYMPAMNR